MPIFAVLFVSLLIGTLFNNLTEKKIAKFLIEYIVFIVYGFKGSDTVLSDFDIVVLRPVIVVNFCCRMPNIGEKGLNGQL